MSKKERKDSKKKQQDNRQQSKIKNDNEVRKNFEMMTNGDAIGNKDNNKFECPFEDYCDEL